MRAAGLAIVVGAAIAVVGINAQAPSPPANLKDVLYNAGDSLGMLRSIQEIDGIHTLEHWATGKATVAGAPYEVSQYRASYNFKNINGPGVRVDTTMRGADGKVVRQIQVVSQHHAWNETEPGISPSPAPDALNERLLRFWSHPFSVVKGATAAGTMTKVTTEGGAIVLTFPATAPSGTATVKATLNRQYQSERVEARLGNLVVETSYSNYADWNWPDYQADVLLPQRIVQRQNGVTILELTTKETNTYNPYVIIPVPANIAKR
jgi:hypothetical protein